MCERVRVRVRVRRDPEIGVVTGLADPSRSRGVEREMVGWVRVSSVCVRESESDEVVCERESESESESEEGP